MGNYKPIAGAGLALTFDNALFSLTASQTDATTPATGESDSGYIHCETLIGSTDIAEISADTGSTFSSLTVYNRDSVKFLQLEDGVLIHFVGNSTGRYRIVASATVGTRLFQMLVTTFS